MARKPDPYLIDEENPELTDEQLASSRPARVVLPPELYEALTKRKPGQRGPAKKPAKVAVTLRIDPDVLEAFKAKGAGWQTRINETLRSSLAKPSSTGRVRKA
jgi:uncharacterized protein (DUF4415 family)